MLFRRIRLLVVAGGIAVAAGLALHGASQPAAPGSFLTMTQAAPSAQPHAAGMLPMPGLNPPAPAPSDGSSVLGGLRLPLSGLFHRLNQETAASATGEYSLLHQLGEALRQHVDAFLRWITGGR